MCGIAGLVGDTSNLDAAAVVQAMVQSLERRGPDAEGIQIWPTAVLGHRRLAIFDLSELGRQPMTSPDRSIGVTFNGAIYNFPVLREELARRGYTFESATDTEVLVHGYREWGIDELVRRLRGMFAFGLWDDRARKLFLVRDRLGVKPLLYSVGTGTLAFASTARALRDGGVVKDLDEIAMAEYLEFGYVTDLRSIYEGTSKVPAATILEWANGTVRMREYWRPPVAQTAGRVAFDGAVETTGRLLLDAVKVRLQADVPVGALLSGGIDSSLVCWAIAKLGGDVTAFTVGTPGDPWDETDDARATARELGIKHEVIDLAPAEPNVDQLVSAYGEPFACASAIGMLEISRAVSKNAKVLLTGDGGDDVFLGYPEHRHLWMAQHVAPVLPPWTWWQAIRSAVPRVGLLRRAATFADFATGGLGGLVATHDGLPMYVERHLLGPRLADVSIEQRSIVPSRSSAKNLLAEFVEYDRRTRFVGEYMTKVDGATMHYGLEARSPFLDQEWWEFAGSLPFALRLQGGRLKSVLRALAARTLGVRVARGRKRGFGIPVQRWIAGRWHAAVDETFRDSLLDREGWITGKAVRRELASCKPGGWAPKQLWYLFVLESWLRHERQTPVAVSSAARALV